MEESAIRSFPVGKEKGSSAVYDSWKKGEKNEESVGGEIRRPAPLLLKHRRDRNDKTTTTIDEDDNEIDSSMPRLRIRVNDKNLRVKL